jgi:uncharacterized membrane protein
MIGLTFALIILPLFSVLGTPVLWGLLPFLMLAVAGLWWGLQRSYRDAEILEELTITPEHIHLVRHNPRGGRQEWDSNAYWAQVELHARGGPVENYLTLKGDTPRQVELGRFLSAEERKTLFAEVRDALRNAASPPATPS